MGISGIVMFDRLGAFF